MLKNMIAWCMAARDLQFLADHIAETVVFSPESESSSAWEIVNQMLREYQQYQDADPEATQEFLEVFLGFCSRNVDVQELAAWLQPLRQSRLLTDALEFVYRSDWTPQGEEPSRWANYRRRLLRIRANMLRRDRQFEAARAELLRLRELWTALENRDSKELSIIEYELGYIEFLANNFAAAEDHYTESIRRAETAGDEIGALISAQTRTHARFRGGLVSPETAKQEIASNLASLRQVSEGQSRAENWVWNALAQLFEFELELGNVVQARRLLEEDVLRHPAFVRSETDPRYQILFNKYHAQLFLAEGDPRKALGYWGKFLELGDYTTEEAKELAETASSEQELSKQYYDAGRALIAIGNSKSACQVWRRGLAESDEVGNRRFKDQIRAMMRANDCAESD